jgi:hypothetical protein
LRASPVPRRRIDAQAPAADFNLNRTAPVWFRRVGENYSPGAGILGQKILSAKPPLRSKSQRRILSLAFCAAQRNDGVIIRRVEP